MRKLLLFLTVVAAITLMFRYPDELKQHSSTFLGKASDYLAEAAGREPPKPVPYIQPLPDDFYWLTQPVRFFHSGGSSLQPAGAPVRKTGESGSAAAGPSIARIMLTDEVGTAVVDLSLVTRDPAVKLSLQNAMPEVGRSRSENTADRLAAIDVKLSSLRQELATIRERDMYAQRTKQKVHFKTSADFVQSTIETLEKLRSELQSSRRRDSASTH